MCTPQTQTAACVLTCCSNSARKHAILQRQGVRSFARGATSFSTDHRRSGSPRSLHGGACYRAPRRPRPAASPPQARRRRTGVSWTTQAQAQPPQMMRAPPPPPPRARAPASRRASVDGRCPAARRHNHAHARAHKHLHASPHAYPCAGAPSRKAARAHTHTHTRTHTCAHAQYDKGAS